jgi:hypothetical protein
MFDPTDPRSSLATQDGNQAMHLCAAQYAKLDETEADEDTGESRTWYVRGQNFVVAYSEARAGATFERESQPDEYMVILPDAEAGATFEAGDESLPVEGLSLVIVPPGGSRVQMSADGRIARIFTARSEDLVARCSNAEAYDPLRPNVAPLEPWPEPTDGLRLRHYSLDVPQEPGRFGRIFRCSTLMVNYIEISKGPRDPTRLSPHHHDDFEQGSLALEGEFVHHLRWPWVPDMTQWREDEHVRCGSPSLTVIPPPAIHTSQAVGSGINLIADIFCPPRFDFSDQPGWVLNGDEYPVPDR